MTDDLIKRLRESANGGQSAGGPRCLHTAAADAIESAAARIAKLETRLEITHVTDGNGKRLEIPPADRDLYPDGIDCRDATIELLDSALESAKRENERLREALEWISANDDAGDMMFHAPGPFAKRARAALATDQKGGEHG